jgi:di/tricarboxylate transporter
VTTDAWITLVVLVVVFAALATERVSTVAGLGAAVGLLLLTDVVDQAEALAGLASSAPLTIAALYVLAGAASVTGALSPGIDRLMAGTRFGAVGKEPAASKVDRGRLARLTVSTAVMSAFLPNTPLVAFAAPRVVTWCRRAGISAAPYLMPLSYAAVIGGVITVIGTSTNLVVSDLLVESGEESLGIFEITPVGLPIAIVAVLVLTLTSHRLLGGRGMTESDLPLSAHTYTLAMRVEPESPLVGRTVQDAGLRSLHGVFLAGIERGGRIVTVRPETLIGADDVCYFAGDVDDVVDVLETPGLVSAEQPHLGDASARVDAGLYEVVIAERSELAGSTLSEVGFRAHYDAAVLAIKRHDDDLPGKLGTVTLRPGDVLLVLATPQFESQWRGHSDFSVIASLDTPPPPRRAHGWVVLVTIAAVIGVAVADVLDLMEAALVAATLLVVFRVISVNEARRSINMNVVLTIALSISLGTAVSVSGLATEMASVLSRIGDPFGDVGKLVAVLIATMALTELLSNNAAAAVMLPIATALAADGGLDPRSMAIVVLIGASCSYLSPIGYQTNLMVYSLGGYRFTDFTRLGAPLTLVTLIITPIVVPLTIGL